MLNLRRLQDKKIKKASAKHSEIDTESEGKVLNLRRLRNRKIFMISERSSANTTYTFLPLQGPAWFVSLFCQKAQTFLRGMFLFLPAFSTF